MEAEAVLGVGVALAAAGLLTLLHTWTMVNTPTGKRGGKVLGLGLLALGAVLSVTAGVALLF